MVVYIEFKFAKGAEFQNEATWYLHLLSKQMTDRGCTLTWVLEGDTPYDMHHKLNRIIDDLYKMGMKCRVEKEKPHMEIEDGDIIRLIIEK